MEWVVGQWVEWCDDAVRVLDMQPKCGLIGVDINGERRWVQEENVKPFVWQVGRTYRTTLDGVTATIKRRLPSGDPVGLDSRDSERSPCWVWCKRTGFVNHNKDDASGVHLLPFLADEPSESEPTLTERYTVEQSGDGWLVRDHQDGRVARFSTRDNAEYGLVMIKDGDDEFCWRSDAQRAADKIFEADPINPQHYRYHPSGIECIQVAEHMSYCLGNAIKYLWRAGKKGDAVEDLKKAAWYVNREIERLTKGGAE